MSLSLLRVAGSEKIPISRSLEKSGRITHCAPKSECNVVPFGTYGPLVPKLDRGVPALYHLHIGVLGVLCCFLFVRLLTIVVRIQPMTYSCPYKGCGRTFVQSNGLSHHLSRGHPESNPSTVFGKRKLQTEQEERKQRSALHRGSVVAGPSVMPVCLKYMWPMSMGLHLTRSTPVIKKNATSDSLQTTHCPRSGFDDILDDIKISYPHHSCR